jgi:hypothetical protein
MATHTNSVRTRRPSLRSPASLGDAAGGVAVPAGFAGGVAVPAGFIGGVVDKVDRGSGAAP